MQSIIKQKERDGDDKKDSMECLRSIYVEYM